MAPLPARWLRCWRDGSASCLLFAGLCPVLSQNSNKIYQPIARASRKEPYFSGSLIYIAMRGPLLFSSFLLAIFSCQRPSNGVLQNANPPVHLLLDEGKLLETIAFGSCNKQDAPQEMWQHVLLHKPQLWMWMGDNIYGDSEDMQVLAEKYALQNSHPEYRQLLAQCPIIGIWDDHDYGKNDGDKNYPKKKESKALMLDFLGVPAKAAVRSREGAYQSYTIGPKGKKVKILLLDGRYFRDELTTNPLRNPRYFENPDGDILGEAQWKWLESELTNSEAQLHLIVSGIQFIPEEQIFEKWANFPAARKRFLNLLVKTKPAGALLLSGDRHIAELCRIEMYGLDQPLYELTSSGLTHTWSDGSEEPNRFREGNLIVMKNFGLMQIDWKGPKPAVTLEVRGLGDALFLQKRIQF